MYFAHWLQAKSPIKTLDELSVTEVLPSLYFPSIMERSEMESLNGSLSCSKTSDHELPANYLDTSHMSIQKNSTDCCQGFGHRSRHRCYVITARARSFLYHQVHFLLFHASLHDLAFLLFICFTPFPIFILSIDRSVFFFGIIMCYQEEKTLLHLCALITCGEFVSCQKQSVSFACWGLTLWWYESSGYLIW